MSIEQGWMGVECPVCGSKELEDFFHVESIPVDAGACFQNREDALAAPRGKIDLTVCRECRYIGNRAFDYELISFGVDYDISLDYSPVYQAFERETVERLARIHDLKNKRILEIGSGPSHFLQLLCEEGGNTGFGIDPSVPRVGTEACGDGSMTLIRELYDDSHADLEVDLVCCRQMFCLLSDPLGFLKTVRRNIGDRLDTAVYFEVPNAEYQYDGPIQWNVFFEYASEFNEASLRRIFAEAGFIIRECKPCYVDGQYIYVDAVPDPDFEKVAASVSVSQTESLETIRSFSDRYKDAREKWEKRLAELKEQGVKVAGWGSGGRGVFFMNMFDTAELIPYVADINPNRQGAYLTGTGQKIVAPEFLKEYEPDVILVTHSTYVEEIKIQAAEIGLTAEIVSV